MANEGAIGELLRQLTGTLQQGRDFNLQRANARASAAIRIQELQLDKEKRKIEEERTRQQISRSETEQRAKELEIRADLATERRTRKLEKIVAAARTVPTSEEGKPFAAFERGPLSDERVVGALEELDRPVGARLAARVEEGALTAPQRRSRRIEEERTVGLTEETAERTRLLREGKDPDEIAQIRLFRDLRRDYNQYIQGLPITNILRDQQGQAPLPELTFEQYTSQIIGGRGLPSQTITVPGLLPGNVASEDSLIFNR